MATSDISLGATALFPTSLMSLFPHLTDTTPVILAITVLPSGTTADANDPCSSRDGVTFSVDGHPEAVVTYYGGTSSQPALDPSLTASTTVGAAEISGLTATPDHFQLTASKARRRSSS